MSTTSPVVPDLTYAQRQLLPAGAVVEYHIDGRCGPGRGCVDHITAGAQVVLCCGQYVHPLDRLILLSESPGPWPHRTDFGPDDQHPRALPPDSAIDPDTSHDPPKRHTFNLKTCIDCKDPYTPTSGHQLRCPPCALIHTRQKTLQRIRDLRNWNRHQA